MPRPRIDRLDGFFLLLGALGLILFLALVPLGHPDAAGTFGIGREAAIEVGAGYLGALGYDTGRLVPSARLARSPQLIDSLQAALGRREAISALLDGARETLPAFFWQVQWFETAHPGFRTDVPPLEVWILPEGGLWKMEAGPEMLPDRPVNRGALVEALAPSAELPTGIGERLTFSLDIPQDADALGDRSTMDLEGLADDAPIALDAADAAALARVQLARTALAVLPLALERVEPLPARGRSAARVRFASTEPVLGQSLETEVDILASGAVLGMRTRFNGVDEHVHAPGTLIVEAGQATYRQALKYGGYILLVLYLLWVAVRRLSVRALDTRAALRDALVVAFFTAVSLVLFAPSLPYDAAGGQLAWLVLIAIVILFNAAILSLLAFITTAGGDALARDHDPRPLQSMTLVRETTWLNVPVGRALLRGSLLAAAIVGMAAVALVTFSAAPISSGGRFVGSQLSLSLFGGALSNSVWYAFVLTHAVFVGLGALLARWRSWLVVPGLAVALAILQVDVVQLPAGTDLLSWTLALAIGAGLALAYVHTDALTILVGLIVATVLWDSSEALLISGSPAWPGFAASLVVLAGAAGMGLRGLASGRTGDSLPRYEPDFVVEQRVRARLQREFEIAREVQQSLLPTDLPEIPGLDLAARCVPAEEVGGDYYDILRLDDSRFAVVIGDVSGKGIQAAFYMTLIKGYLQGLATEVSGPEEMLCRLNRLFRASAPRGTFVSMIYAVVDLGEGTMSFARAGHTPLVVRRGDEPVRTLRPPGVAIGMAPQAVFEQSISQQLIGLHPDDLVVLYTDGISEAMDRRRHQFSDERLLQAVAAAPGSAAAALDFVLDEVRLHVGPGAQFDDLTILALRLTGASGVQHPTEAAVDHSA